MSTQARLYGDFIFQKTLSTYSKNESYCSFKRGYLWYFQKTIVKISCLMSTQARHDGDFIVPKRNPPIQTLILLFAMNNDTIVQTSCVT